MKKLTPAPPAKPRALIGYDDSGDESDDGPTDFFSLTADHSVPTAIPAAVPTSDVSGGAQQQQTLYEQAASSSSDYEQPGPYPLYSEYVDVGEPSGTLAEPQADSGQDYIGFGSNDLQLDEEAVSKRDR